jgi:hypothetical protein
VEARVKSFQSSVEQLLWPERRDKDPVLGDKIPGVIDRTTARSYLWAPAGYLPDFLSPLRGLLNRWLPWIFTAGGDIQIGPIPAGTPVDLIANLNLLPETSDIADRAAHDAKVVDLLVKVKSDLESLPANASDDDARKVFASLADPLLDLSKCPDFVVNRGHYFGTDRFAEEPGLNDREKRDLIEFLKTF